MEGVSAMFQAKRMLFIYVETPLHAGTGRSLGTVDLPIQRERATHYPMIQASSLKGRLRAEMREQKGWLDDHPELVALFGKAGDSGENWAGAISPGDARILLFPVRSLAGVFAWTTSVDALARFLRAAEMVGLKPGWTLPPAPDKERAWVNGDALKADAQNIVLEEFSFAADLSQAETVRKIGQWLANNALPEAGYDYWKQALPKKLCILHEDAFRDFVLYGTEVQTHVRLDPDKKTVQSGALWTTESLPVDTLLYAPLMATPARDGSGMNAEKVLEKIAELNLTRTQLGGDETTGQGMVALRIVGGGQ
ncbi:MAG: type III-B CRISPR module RAMP protein Cmr4 [Anaerolineae bacterium]|nr:type III-B CRISPR module RAMP protein Cmr4 [Anaerolineae bacterium]